jgi:asparagine synthase (glutamine-hydrolysing)
MCGFVGFVSKTKAKKKVIKDMMETISHRGPDSDGLYSDSNVTLGFRRLSIIDLSDLGSQPMYNEDKSLVIVFNGEIYNYQELRKELIDKGHIFSNNADTEVLLHGYEEYGEKLLPMLRGMFSFVIYDIKNKELFGARDFYGIKPFYYYKNGNDFIFGSEIKAFLKHPNFIKELNIDKLSEYLSFQYSPGETTFFKNVYKLLPGHYFKYKDSELTIESYYSMEFVEDYSKSEEEYKEGLEKELDDSIRAHKISDVEVGSFLSSGVDSSFISVKSKVDKTFTVGFDNSGYSEISYAKDLSSKIGVKNISKIITKKEYFKKFPKIQYYMDEPLADPSAIALYFVANVASKHVKVVLSGEGSDEIFSGYNIYQEPLTLPWYYKVPLPIRRLIGKFASLFGERRGLNFFIRRSKNLEERYIGNAFMFNEKEIKNILNVESNGISYKELTKPYYDKVKDKDDITKMQYIDFNFWLVGDILLKADKMSMANSIEVRVPYLDRVLIDYARRIPVQYRIDKNTTKKMFRSIASKVLDKHVSEKKKLGFPVPIRVWLKEEDTYNLVKETFENGSKFFKVNEIIKLLDDHKNGIKDNSRKIWTIYTFLVWYKQYFK